MSRKQISRLQICKPYFSIKPLERNNTIIGIDLGTTSSRVAIYKNGVPVIIENTEGDGTTPSHVTIDAKGKCLVGKPARRNALKEPKNSIFAIKRLIGRRYDDPIVQQLKKFMPYEITKAENGNAWVKMHDKYYSPEQISAMMLNKLKIAAEIFLGHTVTEAVITVPAYYNNSQRQSVKDAGLIAGFNVLRMIAEPTAAAISVIHKQSEILDEKIAVYDLGGGTFDISILEIASIEGEEQFDVLSTNGDTFLGGEDFDLRLVEYIAHQFQKQDGINLLNDPVAVQRLKEAAEEAKITLSTEFVAQINLPFIASDQFGIKHLNISISRDCFEKLILDLVERSIEVCKVALKDSGLITTNLSRVILVGGSTRIPIVHQYLKNYFGNILHAEPRREDLVALGAAIEAGVLGGDVKNVLLLDVIPISLGIETMGGVMTKLLEKNTTIPTIASQVFSTAEDNQTAVTVHVLQGVKQIASANKSLGRFDFVDIPPAPKGSPQIEVSLEVDVNGILNVSANDKSTGKKQRMVVKAKGGLSDNEIKTLREQISENLPFDKKNINSLASDIINPLELQSKFNFNKIFISYAHEDADWAKRIEKALMIVCKNKGYEIWIDRIINTGDYWEEKIFLGIESSNIAILLLSQDFLSSNFILNNELPRIFAEKERRYLQVFPIMVRSCPYQLHNDISKFQFFNNPEKPFASLQIPEYEAELTKLALELAKISTVG